jgi:regulator of protease activity HflC (stomatin/prohibitin superfamily)
MLRETEAKPIPGLLMVLLLIAALAGSVFLIIAGAAREMPLLSIGGAIAAGAISLAFKGLFTVAPNEAQALTLFGNYAGTVRAPGLWWINPFMTRKNISLRVRNFETNKLKVNDARSNPVEIGAIVVWKVTDTAEALFEVNDYVQYVAVQSESAMRVLASAHPYDAHGNGEIALSTHQTEVNAGLMQALHDRLGKAGVEVIEARISHLAYAPEIAAAMLQRQQASAIVAARQTIVEGAVGMVEQALASLKERDIVELDPERKAAMVSNLLVVLCSERSAQPIVNAGSLYS